MTSKPKTPLAALLLAAALRECEPEESMGRRWKSP